MAKVIYSMFVEPDGFRRNKERFNLYSFREYYPWLRDSKEEYAKKIGADWVFFDDLKKVEKFQEKFSIDTIYNAINLYKIFMFEELSKKYDEVLYLDFDVIPNTDSDFFEEIDLSEKIWAIPQTDLINLRNFQLYKDSRSPTLKYYQAQCLLNGKENEVVQTAIMGGSKEVIQRLAFMDKLPRYIETTNELIQGMGYARKIGQDYRLFNHNNESFFSAAIVEEGIELQYDDLSWHERLDNRAVYDPATGERFDLNKKFDDGKFIHFINKNFASYYKDKKNVVYSLHVEIPPELQVAAGEFLGDDVDKNERARINFLKWEKQLEENKKRYANSIGADYVTFREGPEYTQFRSWMKELVPDMSEYDVVNFYKIWCMEELVKDEYDNALYLDFDVVCNTEVSFFDAFNLSNGTACAYNSEMKDEAAAEATSLKFRRAEDYVYHYRSPHAKYWNAYAMLEMEGYEAKNNVYNTGIWGGSRRQLLELGYFHEFEKVMQLMTELREEEYSMYIPQIQKSFGYDNETVMSYRVQSKDTQCFNLSTKFWHYKVDETKHSPKNVLAANPAFYHVMNKKFEWFEEILNAGL